MDELEGAIVDGDMRLLKEWILHVPDALSEVGSLGSPALRLAIECGPLQSVELLLGSGANPQYCALDGCSSLHSAVERTLDAEAVIALLISAGADKEARGINGWTPLQLAAARGKLTLVELLVSSGANIHARTSIDYCETATGEALSSGALDLHRALVRIERSTGASEK